MDNQEKGNICQGEGRDVSNTNIADRRAHSAHATTTFRNPQLAGSSNRRPVLQLRIRKETCLGNERVLHEGQDGFRPGYSWESHLVTVCQDIADSLDEGVRTDAIIRDSSKAFGLGPPDRLLTKIAATGVDLRVVAWVREFPLGRSQGVIVDRQLSEEVRVTSGLPQGGVLGPLL